MRTSPNILVVMADQLNGFSLGANGNMVVRSPNIDTLAEHGVVFDNAYCNSPLCAPSRFSMISGQLPSRIAAYDNAALFAANVPTFAHHLRLMGYQTCLSGKMHFVGPDQMHGFEQRLTTDIYPADFGWVPDWSKPDERIDWWYHNLASVTQAGVAEASNQYDFDDDVGAKTIRKLYDLARGGDNRPFCLVASFTHPHDPYATRRKYWDLYDDGDIDMPRVSERDIDQPDPHSQRLFRAFAGDEFDISDQNIRDARHAYYGNVSYIDEWFGKIRSTLETTGLADNTVVLFLSDHGDMLGERGLWYKMSFFEASARIPMIIAGPDIPSGERVSAPVSLVDLFPTLTDIASRSGQTEPQAVDPLDGQSLLSVMSGQREGEVIGEYLGEGAVAPILMIRRGQYKFIHCPGDPPQLYDLDTDPLELNNLAHDPANGEILKMFENETASRWDVERLHRRVIDDQNRRRLLADALSEGTYTSWDYQPSDDASAQFMRNHLDLNELEHTTRFPAPRSPGRKQ
jgi:choline-sulfatase